MKIKVADLVPNPFREIGKYPIDKRKVKSLKLSIRETTFWDNVLCRQNNGKFEIAYGHHRLEALKELGMDEVDIPVKKLTDSQMVRIMAEENLEWLTSPKVINQTVLAVKKYLDGELAKREDLEHLNKSIKVIFTSNSQFQQCKKDGVGQTTILKFLGGNWKQWMIQSALATAEAVKEGTVDRKAVETIPTIDQANNFRAAVIRHKIPKPIQRKLAKKIVKEKISTKKIDIAVRKAVPQETQSTESPEYLRIRSLIENIDSQARTLINQIMLLRKQMQILEVQELNGAKTWLANSSLNRLFKELELLKERNQNETDS